MGNLSKSLRHAGSGAARTAVSGRASGDTSRNAGRRTARKPSKSQVKASLPRAQGRLDHGPPVAVIDIGSNSVRLVVYEGLTRSPTPIFNEKVLAGLGRQVQSTGLLAADAVTRPCSR